MSKPLLPNYYIVEPRKKLVLLVDHIADDYSAEQWKYIVVWHVPETSDSSNEYAAHNMKLFKVIFLMGIIQTFSRHIATNLSQSSYARIIKEIFGTPPKFHIDIIDEWWKITKADNDTSTLYIIRDLTVDTLRSIQKTGDKNIDAILDKLIEYRVNNLTIE